MVDPFNITRKIFRNQPWALSVQINQGGFTAVDLSAYEIKAVLCRLTTASDCTGYQALGPIVFSNDAPVLSVANTKATFVFQANQTGALQLGDCSYRWIVEMAPSGAGSGASVVVCAGPAAVYDSPPWGAI